MLPSDRSNKKSTKRTSTFLGVDPGTLTIRRIRQKGERDKAAADKRAPIVNAGIERQDQKLYGALAYQDKAKELYASTGVRGRDSQVVDSARRLFSTPKTLTPEGRYKYNFSSAGGQYQVARSAIDYWNENESQYNP